MKLNGKGKAQLPSTTTSCFWHCPRQSISSQPTSEHGKRRGATSIVISVSTVTSSSVLMMPLRVFPYRSLPRNGARWPHSARGRIPALGRSTERPVTASSRPSNSVPRFEQKRSLKAVRAAIRRHGISAIRPRAMRPVTCGTFTFIDHSSQVTSNGSTIPASETRLFSNPLTTVASRPTV